MNSISKQYRACLCPDHGTLIPYETLQADETFELPIAFNENEHSGFSIALTRSDATRYEALRLINRRYAWRGYGSAHKLSGRGHETTFVARWKSLPVGTITLGADSERGLDVEKTFANEVRLFRRQSRDRVCELKKLAVEYKSSSKDILAALFHFIFIYGTENNLGTRLLVEVNPRHVLFYERMLGFACLGDLKTNSQVGAPSQLMWLSVDRISSLIEDGRAGISRHSLYNYFYDADRQLRIAQELRSRGLVYQN